MLKAINRGIFFYIGKYPAIANYIHVANVIEALLLCAHASSQNGITQWSNG